ncbi:Kalirin [Armadillidium vulgare]|nr:Kalirin [Armadillidium vulgare]
MEVNKKNARYLLNEMSLCEIIDGNIRLVVLLNNVNDRPGPPSRPEIADMAGQALTLRWEAPTDDGGCRITNYIVEYFRIGWDVWLKATSSNITWAQMDELIVGSEYRFRVKAENAYGISEPSKESLQILIEEGKSDPGSFESGNATPSPALKRKEQQADVLLSVDIASETSSDAGSFDISENRKQIMRDRMSDSSSDIHSEGEKTFTGSATKEVDEDVTVIVAPRRKVVEESLSESGDLQEPEDTENVEEFLGDYLNRWEAYGGQSFGKELLNKAESTYDKKNIPAEEYEIYISKKKAIEQAEEILRELEEDNFVVEKEGVSPLQRFDEEEVEAKPKKRKHVPRTSSPRKDKTTAYQEVLPTDDIAQTELYDYAESERLYENITDNLIFQKEEDFQRKKRGGEEERSSPCEKSKKMRRKIEEGINTNEEIFQTQEPHNTALSPKDNNLLAPPRRSSSKTPSPLPVADEDLLRAEFQPTPPPRHRRSGSRSSDVSDSSSIFDNVNRSDFQPTPPPRRRRSGSRTSDVSESSSFLDNVNRSDFQPTPPPRRRRSGSRTSDVSESSSFLDVPLAHCGFDISERSLESPKVPPRTKRSSSRTSIISDLSLLDLENYLSNYDMHEGKPQPTVRPKRASSRVSNDSEDLENYLSNYDMQEGKPLPPVRSKRASSRVSNDSEAFY